MWNGTLLLLCSPRPNGPTSNNAISVNQWYNLFWELIHNTKNSVSMMCTKKQQRSLNPNKKKRLKHLMCPFKLFSKHSLDWWREQEGLWKMQQSQRPWTQLQRLVKGHLQFCDTLLVKYVSFIPAFSFLSTAEITVRGKVSTGTLQTSIITQPTTGS